MRLSDFIVANAERIYQEWENFARTALPAAARMEQLALRDHIQDLLAAIVADMGTAESARAKSEKSRGLGADNSGAMGAAASAHAAARLLDQFSAAQVLAEFRALRASVIRLWREGQHSADAADLDDLIRFDEAVDQLISQSVEQYANRVDQAKDMLLGVIGHELRDPLATIAMSTELLAKTVGTDAKYAPTLARLNRSVERMGYIVADLFDLTIIRLGNGMQIVPVSCDLAKTCEDCIEDIQATHQNSPIHWEKVGNCHGRWDESRLRQVIMNLLGNAIKHGNAEPIQVAITGNEERVVVNVTNRGPVIRPEDRVKIFGPLMRGLGKRPDANGLGLGLYISKAIVEAHHGNLDCTSSATDGTTFAVSLPKAQPR
jgi:signal transduction histidine kinase